MCTVTFFPTESGYVVAMNRDDLFARARTSPPSEVRSGTRTAIYPAEIGGGTWIGTNDAGLTLCLLNWHRPAGPKVRSRGEVIPRLLASGSIGDVEESLRSEPPNGTHPFRLVGISLNERTICEWRWDGAAVDAGLPFAWKDSHWFSSGLSDEEATRNRLAVCEEAHKQQDAFSIDWVRRLHRSHAPERGAFSICAHRPEAGTLSYTEVAVEGGLTEINHIDASPCVETPLGSVELRRHEVQTRSL